MASFVQSQSETQCLIKPSPLGFQSCDEMIAGKLFASTPGAAAGIPDKALDLGARHADTEGSQRGEVAELTHIAFEMEFQDLRQIGETRQ